MNAGRAGTPLRRLAGAVLAVLVAVPVHRVLSGRETGLAGEATVVAADVTWAFVWTGTLVVVLVAALAARLLPASAAARVVDGVRGALLKPRAAVFAAGVALLAFVLSTAFVLLALDGRPAHLDAISQMLHARFVAAGQPAGPIDIEPAFWQIQNSVVTSRGWVSQYPPGHVILLAAGVLAGAAWVVGPMMVALATYFSARLADRLLVEHAGAARAGALLVACSPFVVCLGGSFMNHAPTLGALAAAAWFAVRTAEGDERAAYVTGAAIGVAFTIRPLSALAVGLATTAAVWLQDATGLRGRVTRAALGMAPFVAAIALYNRAFFGSATTFGYDVALGPSAGLGFGRDPWGNVYGPVEALGYTASDLVALGGALLESPLSPVLLVALLLLLAARLTRGERILAAWALAPVAANALYWHHGLFMGPRMLFEAAPAWILLAVSATARAWDVASTPRLAPLRPAIVAGAACTLALALWQAPQRALGYAPGPDAVTAVRAPAVQGPALVFVHDAWTARLAMQLAGSGMRLDVVETALRQNPTCDVQALVDALARGDELPVRAQLQRLDLEPRSRDLPQAIELSTGNTARIDPERAPTADCARQAAADRNGILDLAPLLLLGDLPGAEPRGALFVRDLGPERNAALIARLQGRAPYVLRTTRDGAAPELVAYEAGMRELWRPLAAEMP